MFQLFVSFLGNISRKAVASIVASVLWRPCRHNIFACYCSFMSFLLLFIFISTTDALSKTAPNITAFLTFRVNSPKLVHTTGRLMEKIKEFDPRLEKFTTNLEKLHITIDVYHVDERNIER